MVVDGPIIFNHCDFLMGIGLAEFLVETGQVVDIHITGLFIHDLSGPGVQSSRYAPGIVAFVSHLGQGLGMTGLLKGLSQTGMSVESELIFENEYALLGNQADAA